MTTENQHNVENNVERDIFDRVSMWWNNGIFDKRNKKSPHVAKKGKKKTTLDAPVESISTAEPSSEKTVEIDPVELAESVKEDATVEAIEEIPEPEYDSQNNDRFGVLKIIVNAVVLLGVVYFIYLTHYMLNSKTTVVDVSNLTSSKPAADKETTNVESEELSLSELVAADNARIAAEKKAAADAEAEALSISELIAADNAHIEAEKKAAADEATKKEATVKKSVDTKADPATRSALTATYRGGDATTPYNAQGALDLDNPTIRHYYLSTNKIFLNGEKVTKKSGPYPRPRQYPSSQVTATSGSPRPIEGFKTRVATRPTPSATAAVPYTYTQSPHANNTSVNDRTLREYYKNLNKSYVTRTPIPSK